MSQFHFKMFFRIGYVCVDILYSYFWTKLIYLVPCHVFSQLEPACLTAACGTLLWKFPSEVEIVLPGNLTTNSSFTGFRESRLPHPTSSTLSISMYNSFRGGEKGGIIIQRNVAKKRFSTLRARHRSGRGLPCGKGLPRRWISDWKHRGTFMYHAHVTIIYHTDSKGITKRRETWQRAEPASNRGK